MPVPLYRLRLDCRDHLDESKPHFWQEHELDRWINEAVRDVARRCEDVQEVSTGILVYANMNKYALPSDVIRVHRVEFKPTSSSYVYPLSASNYQQMDQYWGSNQLAPSTYPGFYVMWGAPPTLTIQLYPVPSQTGNLNVFYYRLPREMRNEQDTADVPEGWHDLIPLYVEYVAKRKDHDATWQEAKQLYEERLAQMYEMTRQWHDQATQISRQGAPWPWAYDEDYA